MGVPVVAAKVLGPVVGRVGVSLARTNVGRAVFAAGRTPIGRVVHRVRALPAYKPVSRLALGGRVVKFAGASGDGPRPGLGIGRMERRL